MEFKLRGGMPGMPQLPPGAPYLLIVPGALLIGFALLLFFNPWLIAYMIASLFLVVGGLLVFAGMRAKRMLG